MYASEINSAPLSDEGLQAFSNSNASLLRALENEQEAHNSTKSQLEQEINARYEAEAETRRLAEHNKRLLSSIKLLQSTVKHMTQKENMPPTTPTLGTKEGPRSDVKVGKAQAESARANDSILYDVLSNYKVPQKTIRNGEESTAVIHLDLLSTPDSNDHSEKAHLRRTLRTQLGLSSEPEEKPKQGADADMDNVPRLPELERRLPAIVQQEEEDHMAITDHAPAKSVSVAVNRARPWTPAQLDPAPEFVYNLPTAFLSKYGKKPANTPDTTRVEAGREELPPPQTPRKASLTVTSPIKTRGVEDERKPLSRVVHMPDSPMISWKVDRRHVDELRGRYVETKFQSHFTDHPIRYGEQYLFSTPEMLT